MSQLDNMKLKLYGTNSSGETDSGKDALLQLYLDDAESDIVELTHLDALPPGLLSTQVELAIIYYNKEGIEGQTAHSEGGVSRTFEDIPPRMLKKIHRFRKLPR